MQTAEVFCLQAKHLVFLLFKETQTGSIKKVSKLNCKKKNKKKKISEAIRELCVPSRNSASERTNG